jgi:hypothetical protein
MSDTSAIQLLVGLLADPSGLKNRLNEFSAAHSGALTAEGRLDAARSEFAAHRETVVGELQQLEKSVATRRGRVEADEGLNESRRSTIAEHAARWKGIRMPNEVSHG